MRRKSLLQAIAEYTTRLAEVQSTQSKIAESQDSINPEENLDVGELDAAEYVIFSLALETYLRHLGESVDFQLQQAKLQLESLRGSGSSEEIDKLSGKITELKSLGIHPVDKLGRQGLVLLRRLDGKLDAIHTYLSDHMQRDSQRRVLDRSLRPSRGAQGASRRALNLRLLMRDVKVVNGVFQTAQARRQVKAAVAAHIMDDGDAALDLFAAMPATIVRNTILRKWIDAAAENAQPLQSLVDINGYGPDNETLPVVPERITPPAPNTIVEATSAVVEETPAILAQQVQQSAATGAEAYQEGQAKQADLLGSVEKRATEAAKGVLSRTGEVDIPPTKSEVVGIATAAVVSAMSDMTNPQNVPETIKRLDPEQRAAALTSGRVLVLAGPGSGKSTTLVSRVNYLVRDCGASPNRILVTSFNTKAAAELKVKVGKAAGGDVATAMQIGTMHSLFKRFITQYGNTEEKSAMRSNPSYISASAARTAQSIWSECFDKESDPPPRVKDVRTQMTVWAGNDITPKKAMELATTEKQLVAARWYEIYEGLKGSIPGWKPPCEEKTLANINSDYANKYETWIERGRWGKPPQKPGTTFERFMVKHRPEGQRVGDFSDMIAIFRNILKRDPAVRKEVQKLFDHILVDECQDLNQVQTEIFEMMSEHISEDAKDKSVWMVGDIDQSINGFVGARPDLFKSLYDKPDWKTRMIRTNYRCAPEIVDLANKLIAHNTERIPMEFVANPSRARGEANISVDAPLDAEQGAIGVVEKIRAAMADGEKAYSDFAVISRTNRELHTYEAACLTKGIPYARKGVSSFLGSPEVKGVLGYVDLALGVDNLKLQKAMSEVLNTPRRFWVSDPEKLESMFTSALEGYVRIVRRRNESSGVKDSFDIRSINPVDALRDSDFQNLLASKMGITDTRTAKYRDAIEQLHGLADFVDHLREAAGATGYRIDDLFDEVLGLEGKVVETDPQTGAPKYTTKTFRESVVSYKRDSDAEDDDDTSGDDDKYSGLGNIAFLFELAKPDPESDVEDPGTPAGFANKMSALRDKAADLRINIEKWETHQASLPPDQRVPPPGVYLGTAHSTKGAEWNSVFVQMPKGKFPMVRRSDPTAPEESPEEMDRRMEEERRLAYVALTRAATNLTVVCPKVVGGAPGGVSPFVYEAGLLESAPTVEEPAEIHKEAYLDSLFGTKQVDPFSISWNPFGA